MGNWELEVRSRSRSIGNWSQSILDLRFEILDLPHGKMRGLKDLRFEIWD